MVAEMALQKVLPPHLLEVLGAVTSTLDHGLKQLVDHEPVDGLVPVESDGLEFGGDGLGCEPLRGLKHGSGRTRKRKIKPLDRFQRAGFCVAREGPSCRRRPRAQSVRRPGQRPRDRFLQQVRVPHPHHRPHCRARGPFDSLLRYAVGSLGHHHPAGDAAHLRQHPLHRPGSRLQPRPAVGGRQTAANRGGLSQLPERWQLGELVGQRVLEQRTNGLLRLRAGLRSHEVVVGPHGGRIVPVHLLGHGPPTENGQRIDDQQTRLGLRSGCHLVDEFRFWCFFCVPFPVVEFLF
mmetsp:Transcript_7650/g.18495  ORF Transcript_7650/g.18495 Transcript_7650/m.18495 type:complete len:292 (-) Transcript_7650:826-1701(-)